MPEIELRNEMWENIVKIAEKMGVSPETVVDLALSLYISENWRTRKNNGF